MSTRLLTYRQAADLLACSPRTIARRVRSGLLTVVIDGGMRRIPERDLDRYVSARTLTPRSQQAAAANTRLTPAAGAKRAPGRPPFRVHRLWDRVEAPGDEPVGSS